MEGHILPELGAWDGLMSCAGVRVCVCVSVKRRTRGEKHKTISNLQKSDSAKHTGSKSGSYGDKSGAGEVGSLSA